MTSRSLKSDAIKGGKWTTVSAVVGVIVQLSQLSILGRLLGPESFGQMAIMMVVIGLANSLADFGMGNYLIQSEKVTSNLFWILIGFCAFASLMLSCLIFLIAPSFASYYDAPQLVSPLTWLSIVVIMNSIGQIPGAVLQKNLKFKFISAIEMASIITGMIVSIFYAWNGDGIWGLVLGQLSLSALKAALSFFIAFRLVLRLPKGVGEDLWKPLHFGILQTNERIFNFMSVNLDKLIIGKFLGEHALGLYSVAFQLMLRPIMVVGPIFSRVLYPLFSHIKNDNDRLIRGYLEIIRTSGLMLFPIYLFLSASSFVVIHMLLGPKWTEAAPLLSILSILGFSYSLGGPLSSLILAKGRADLALYLNIFSFLLNMIACYIGSQYEIKFVAVLLVTFNFAFLLPCDIYLRKILIGMPLSAYLNSLKYLFFGALGPIIIFNILFNYLRMDLLNSLCAGILSTIAFFTHIFIYDRPLIKNTVKLIKA